ncbi:hydrophobic surface binding protein A-domain-containing protein [Lyophyllum atratum]|nr:hydrophobic surface binding protein A-domain-containing protein [Lyophyllum atratum]
MNISSTFPSASLGRSGSAATVNDVKADLATISSQLRAVHGLVDAFPTTGGSLILALAIHAEAVNLGSTIDRGTAHVKAVPLPISDADGRALLASVKTLEPAIANALRSLVAKKATALSITGVINILRQDLANLNSSATALENAMIMAAPANLVPEASALKKKVDAEFASAVAAYA